MSGASARMEAAGADRWLVRAERSAGGRSAVGEVLVRAPGLADPDITPHAGLAAARAWLSLGERLLEERAGPDAAAAAQAGLDELGSEYAPPGTKDDTQVRLLLAADRLAEGDAARAAEEMLRMLEVRLELYAGRNAATIVR